MGHFEISNSRERSHSREYAVVVNKLHYAGDCTQNLVSSHDVNIFFAEYIQAFEMATSRECKEFKK
jgi:hypothetical protein